MLTYSFADIGSDSMYEHLYKCIKKDIISRKIKSGAKLPSKRSFAKNLGISVITIENAYDQLMGEGYVYSIAKKGYFVADINSVMAKKQIMVNKENMIMAAAEERYMADFSSNRINLGQFPFSVWSKLLRECLSDYQEDLLIKPPSGGAFALRKAIANHLREFRDMFVDPEQIIIGAGTEYLYGQIVQLLGQNKIYGVEDPGFQKTSQVYQVCGATVKHISLNRDGISVEELEQEKVQVAHISPSHQFPTGKITPISRRYELLGWASKADERYIIEDDYDSEFRMTGKPIPTLMSIDVNEKVIYLNTFSKSIANTVRISYMVLPKHLMELYYRKMSFYSCPVTSIIQLTVAKFISDGYFEKHINRLRNFYKKQRDILVEEIQNSELSSYAEIKEADAGLHFLLCLNITCSDKEFARTMEKNGIKICAVSEYYNKPDHISEHEFVINYSSLSEEQIKEAVQIMSREVGKLNITTA